MVCCHLPLFRESASVHEVLLFCGCVVVEVALDEYDWCALVAGA